MGLTKRAERQVESGQNCLPMGPPVHMLGTLYLGAPPIQGRGTEDQPPQLGSFYHVINLREESCGVSPDPKELSRRPCLGIPALA